MEHVTQTTLFEQPMKPTMIDTNNLIEELNALSVEDRIEAINQIKLQLHEVSPFKGEPVDCVLWVKADNVEANDYNPNSVAPPEMELLEVSILEDGYTQPIVTFEEESHRTVIDGFHRNRVGKESKLCGNASWDICPL
jgi:ParB-like chromosome segregation protein Spo0J